MLILTLIVVLTHFSPNHLKVDCFEEHLDEIHHGEMNVGIEKSLEIYF